MPTTNWLPTIITAIATLIGVFGGSFLSHTLQMTRENKKEVLLRKQADEDEQKRNDQLLDKSLNLVLSASIKIIKYGYVTDGGEFYDTFFDTRKYINEVRPALYEHFDLLPFEMRYLVLKIDDIIQNGEYESYYIYLDDVGENFKNLLIIIRQRYGFDSDLD